MIIISGLRAIQKVMFEGTMKVNRVWLIIGLIVLPGIVTIVFKIHRPELVNCLNGEL